MSLRISKKKFIYLISPNKIPKNFYKQLNLLLKSGKVGIFQMRLKDYSMKKKKLIGKKIRKICKKNSVKFLVNDDPILAKELDADGCHLGQSDMNIRDARTILGKKIIGITCHNSIKLSKAAINLKANYLAFGAFFSTRTKKIRFRANPTILERVRKITNIPLVAIGGINSRNYKKLLLKKVNFLAISSYIWKNKKYKPLNALRKLK